MTHRCYTGDDLTFYRRRHCLQYAGKLPVLGRNPPDNHGARHYRHGNAGRDSGTRIDAADRHCPADDGSDINSANSINTPDRGIRVPSRRTPLRSQNTRSGVAPLCKIGSLEWLPATAEYWRLLSTTGDNDEPDCAD